MSTTEYLRAFAALGALAWAAAPAAAEETAYPRLSGEVAIEIQNDLTFASDDAGAEINDLFTKVEPAIVLDLMDGLSIQSGLVLEPVAAPEPGENRVFGDQGLFVEVLTLNFEQDDFAVYGGKFGPNFGIAWDAAPGIYGTDTAEDYEVSERIGLGGSIAFGGERLGRHTLSASAFFLDTSVLADSWPRGRGNTSRSDGGPSNTGTLDSFAVALDGEIAVAPGLAYHLAFIDQARGAGGAGRERGLAAALSYEAELGDDVTVAPLFEYVRLENLGNATGANRTYVTAAAAFGWRQWSAVAAYTGRFSTGPAGTADQDDFQVQLSLGYTFDSGIAVELGWKHARDAAIDSHTVGLLLSYGFSF